MGDQRYWAGGFLLVLLISSYIHILHGNIYHVLAAEACPDEFYCEKKASAISHYIFILKASKMENTSLISRSPVFTNLWETWLDWINDDAKSRSARELDELSGFCHLSRSVFSEQRERGHQLPSTPEAWPQHYSWPPPNYVPRLTCLRKLTIVQKGCWLHSDPGEIKLDLEWY